MVNRKQYYANITKIDKCKYGCTCDNPESLHREIIVCKESDRMLDPESGPRSGIKTKK